MMRATGVAVGARRTRRMVRGALPARAMLCRATSINVRAAIIMSNAQALRRPQKSVRFPSPHVPSLAFSSDDVSFHARLTELEQMTTDIRERMAHVEAGFLHVATKNDVTTLESTLLKWFIGTAIALTGFVFAAARLVH